MNKILLMLLFPNILSCYFYSEVLLEVAFFPNFIRAQALIGKSNGIFEKSIGAKINWKAINARRSAIESLLIIAGSAIRGACLVIKRILRGNKMFKNMLAKIMYKPLIKKILDKAFKKISFSYDPVIFSIVEPTKHVKEFGYIPGKENVDINSIVDLNILTSLLQKQRKNNKIICPE